MDQKKTWCSLTQEILSLILSRLSHKDMVRFYAVCKSWSKTPCPIIPSILHVSVGSFHNDLPFLLLPSNKLFHPIYKFSHRTQVFDLPHGVIRASHCGWLLMTAFKRRIFFFNPFTNEKVELPDMPSIFEWPNMTFSSPPTSQDCLVFGVQQDIPGSYEDNTIYIYIIKPEQPNWTLDIFDSRPYFDLSSCNPIMYRGQYFCLAKGGSLLIYSPAAGKCRNKCRWVGPPKPSLHRDQIIRYYMVESQGKLLMVFTDVEGHSVNVAMYSAKRCIWEKVHNLGDTMLFVSPITSFSAKSVVRGTGNKIYFPKFVKDNQLFYSLVTHKFHYQYVEDYDGTCIQRICYWKSFDGTKSYTINTWI